VSHLPFIPAEGLSQLEASILHIPPPPLIPMTTNFELLLFSTTDPK
jgi:hypothetical protein